MLQQRQHKKVKKKSQKTSSTSEYKFLLKKRKMKNTGSYLAMASLNASLPAAGRYTGLPSASKAEMLLREQSVVDRMNLQVWGTSTETCAADSVLALSFEFSVLGQQCTRV